MILRPQHSPLLFLLCFLSPACAADTRDWLGQSLSTVIGQTEQITGQEIVYSSRLVKPDYLVTLKPTQIEPLQALRQVLAPYGLTIQARGLKYYVLKDKTIDSPSALIVVVTDDIGAHPIVDAALAVGDTNAKIEQLAPGTFRISNLSPGPQTLQASAPQYQAARRTARVIPGSTSRHNIEMVRRNETALEDIVVSTSRYNLTDGTMMDVVFDSSAIDSFPNVGGDPLRLTQRVPGTAFNSVSAKSHIRGGENSETLLVLNGLELTDPFHLRDYQSLFSAINHRTLESMQIYTGSFPARYEDTLSGVVNMTTHQPQQTQHELAVSFFNTSYVSSGLFADGSADWLVSARRGNLDLVVDTVNNALGEPNYIDLLTHVKYYFNEDTALSFDALIADDNVLVVAEALAEEREQSETDAHNTQVWATLDHHWTDQLSSKTMLAYNNFRNMRDALSNDPEGVVGNVIDHRTLRELRVKQDFLWQPAGSLLTHAGVLWRHGTSAYDYRASAQSEDFVAQLTGSTTEVSRQFLDEIRTNELSAYVSTRLQPSDAWTVEAGARWARQSHTPDGSTFSPRLNLLYQINKNNRLRLSMGRFFQTQKLYDLQIQDGITNFFPAQKSDHVIASYERTIKDRIDFRLEAYDKRLRTPRPRYENFLDPLATIPELAPDRIRLAPTASRAYGVEVSLSQEGDTPWNWWSSYSWSKATDTIDNQNVYRSWDQRHAFAGGFAYRNDRWNVSLSANLRSGWPTTLIELNERTVDTGANEVTPTLGQRNAARLGSFGSIDLHVARVFNTGDSKVTLFLNVVNLLSDKNPCCVEFDFDDEEAPFLTSETEYWLPMIPSLGLRWEF